MLVHCAFILTFISFVAPRDNSILPDPLSGECGKIEYGMEHETNNSQTRLGEHPWVVEIIYWYPETKILTRECSGALITKRHVITASNCIVYIGTDELVGVRFGDWNHSTTVDCEYGVCGQAPIEIPVEEKFTKSEPGVYWANGIGILKLARDIPLSKWIFPICLPNPKVHEKILSYVGNTFFVGGWSRTIDGPVYGARSEVKLVRKIVIDQNEICEDDYRYRNKYDRIFHVCVNSSAAPCEYDSPIMAIDTSSPDNRYWYLFGVFTYGPPHCNSFPKINTQVFPELKWILRMIRL